VVGELRTSAQVTLELVVQHAGQPLAGGLTILIADANGTEAGALARAGDDDLTAHIPKTVRHGCTSG